MSYFLESKRLGFRHWTRDDTGLAETLWCDSDVMRYMGGAYDQAGANARLALEMQRQAEHNVQYWPMFLLTTGEHVGCSGLRPFHDKVSVMELGVHIARTFWGARYGEEAACAVIRYGFELLGLRAIVAGHGQGNINSKLLLQRLGFAFSHEEPWGALGVLHPYYRLDLASWVNQGS